MNIEPAKFIFAVNVTSDDRVKNITANAGRDLPPLDFKRVAICASGPSLADHIEDIRDRQNQGWHVATMNGSHNFLIEHGIIPDLFFMVDARPINLPFLTKANDHTTYIIASQCQPEIFEALQGRKVLLWQMFHDQAGIDAIQANRARQSALFVGSMNVGHSCLAAILGLGYRDWHLFGYDGSMRLIEHTVPTEVPGETFTAGKWEKHAFPQPQNDGEEVQEFFWPIGPGGEQIEGATQRYLATPTMAHAAMDFPARVDGFRRIGINLEIIGSGLIPDMVRGLSTREGAVTATALELAKPIVPPANPRKRRVDELPIVTFKWKGHIPYTAEDVNIWGRQVDRHTTHLLHEPVCITDDPAGIDGGIRTIPMWRDHFEHGRDWHRLKLFSEEMADLIGPRFVVMDLDTLIVNEIDSLFVGDAPFKAWQDPNRDQYCTALFMMDAGAYPHVWDSFDPVLAMRLRTLGLFGGYDQAWISHILPGMPRWTRDNGVISFRADILEGRPLEQLRDTPSGRSWAEKGPNENVRIINFHGKYNPRDAAVQEALPWIAKHWR